MSDTYKTQCPNCQTVYKVGIKQLAAGYKQARCKRCKHQFVMRDNLVTESLIAQKNKSQSSPTQSSPTQSNKPKPSSTDNNPSPSSSNNISITSASTITVKPAINKAIQATTSTPSSNTANTTAHSPPTDDALIYDDMPLSDESTNNDVEDFKKLQDEWSEESLSKAVVGKNDKEKATFFSDNEEDTWLSKLLHTEDSDASSADSVIPTGSRNKNDYKPDEDDSILNNLLDELGVDTIERDMPNLEQSMQRMQERLQTKAIGTDKKRNKKSFLVILLWALGCLALLLLLPAQYAWFNLDHLAKDPNHRDKLQSFCNIAPCTVPGTDLSKFVIPNQTVKANPNSANKSDIIATLVNTSEQSQLYPALKVSIYDQNGIVGDFIAEPKDYLTVDQRLMSSKKTELFMLSVNIPTQNIHRIDISPLY